MAKLQKPEETKKYIGTKEVKSIEDNIATFVDGDSMFITDKQQEYLVTSEPKNLTEEQDLVLVAVTKEVLDVLEEHNVKQSDMNAIWQNVLTSYTRSRLMAIWRAFGTYKEGLSPQYYEENVRISDIKKLLTRVK